MPYTPRPRTRATYLIAIGVSCLAVILIPLTWLSAGTFAAYAGAVQAIGVLFAIIIAVTALQNDSRDRRVDRTMELHRELTTDRLGEARRRLGAHLRMHGSSEHPVKSVLMSALRDDESLSVYQPPISGGDPFDDLNQIIRFFERCWMALIRGSVDQPIFAELIGQQAAWWDLALIQDHTNARQYLSELSIWAAGYAASNAGKYPNLADWGRTRRYDFPTSPNDTGRNDLGSVF